MLTGDYSTYELGCHAAKYMQTAIWQQTDHSEMLTIHVVGT